MTWNVLGSTKTVLIEKDGILKNFSDREIEKLNEQWLSIKSEYDRMFLINKIEQMRKEYDRPEPKDGDVWEFGKMSEGFKEIQF